MFIAFDTSARRQTPYTWLGPAARELRAKVRFVVSRVVGNEWERMPTALAAHLNAHGLPFPPPRGKPCARRWLPSDGTRRSHGRSKFRRVRLCSPCAAARSFRQGSAELLEDKVTSDEW
jgi:hypothetical protein